MKRSPHFTPAARTLTVTSGRETIGFISEIGERQFVAVLASTGRKLGPFPTQSDAALAINAEGQKGGDE